MSFFLPNTFFNFCCCFYFIVLTEKQLLEKQHAGELEIRPKTISKAIKSNVWSIFHEIVDKSNSNIVSNFVKCTKCDKFQPFKGPTTTQLNRHKCSSRQQNLLSFVSKKTTVKKEDLENLKNACVKFVVKDIRPYFAVEGDGFIDVLKCMTNIGLKYPFINESEIEDLIPSRNTVKNEVEKVAHEVKSEIEKYFQDALIYSGGFGVTTDLWSDDFKNNTFLCLTAHINLLKDNEIKSMRFIIHLNQFDAMSKTGVLLEKEIVEIFQSFGVSKETLQKQITFVTDRGPNIKAALKDYNRIYCFAHIVNNIVEEMCKHEDVKKLITDATSLVKFIKSANLNHRCKPTLKSYTKTRWNTVYDMLRTILCNYSNIVDILNEKDRLSNDNYVRKITVLSKYHIAGVVDFLKLFKDITDDIEGEKYATLHYIIPSYKKIEQHLAFSDADLHMSKK